MKRITAAYFNKIANTSDVFYTFSDEERKKFQKCLLDIYSDIACVCEKHNLCIMLSGGSALGAVRHQGFIPWDDDLDAMMPRKDYNKLIEIFDEELGDKYLLSVPGTKQESNEVFMEIIKKNTLMRRVYNNKKRRNGIRIDIFPIDNAPTNKWVRRIVACVADGIRIVVGCKNTYDNNDYFYKKCLATTFKTKLYYYARYIIGMLFSFVPHKYLCYQFNQFVSGIKGDTYCAISMGRNYYQGEILSREIFFPVQVAWFEGKKVYIPNDADTYLRNIYGDYMQLPPVEKREQHFIVEFSYDTAK